MRVGSDAEAGNPSAEIVDIASGAEEDCRMRLLMTTPGSIPVTMAAPPRPSPCPALKVVPDVKETMTISLNA